MKPTDGAALDRVDGPAKITGHARYSYEIEVPGVVYAQLITSTIASGSIADVDSSEAERSPGVLAVLTYKNAPRLPNQGEGGTQPASSSNRATQRKLSLLQDNHIYYNNQPIGVVVALTLEQAQAAARLVRWRYAPTPHIVEPDRQTPYMPKKLSHEDERIDESFGDADGQFEKAAHKVDVTYTSPFEFHNPMEPHATTVVWSENKVTLYDATQGVFTCRSRVADILGLPRTRCMSSRTFWAAVSARRDRSGHMSFSRP
jgi:xanthine dehydrogenase YagR molybdenum-binding subunit